MKKVFLTLVPALVLIFIFKSSLPEVVSLTDTPVSDAKRLREKVSYKNEVKPIDDRSHDAEAVLDDLEKRKSKFKSRKDYLSEMMNVVNKQLAKTQNSQKAMAFISGMLERISDFECYKVLNGEINGVNSEFIDSCEKRLENSDFFEKLRNTKRAETTCNIDLPYSKKGCQGECCGRVLPILKAAMSADIFKSPNVSSKTIGKVKKSENLKTVELLLQTIEYGELVIENETIDALSKGFREGDKIKVISLNGEGSMTICQGEKASYVQFPDLEGVRVIKDVNAKQWTKVTNLRGVTGYVEGIAYQTYLACGSAEEYY